MTSIDLAEQPVTVRLHRDHDPAVAAIPGIDIGPARLGESVSDTVVQWIDQGVRKVTLPGLVDLTVTDPTAAADAVRRLVLVRELTSRAIAVDWSVRLPAGDDELWRVYSHLHVPARLELHPAPPESAPAAGSDPAAAQLTAWRDAFYFDKCVYRRGPGFVQVRDRRSGRLNLLTIDDPEYLAVLERLLDGARISDVNLDIAREFGEEGLVTKTGDRLVWLPHRLRRWPLPSMVV
ncbi:DUF5825 family protein [Solwaraspora sp. WMMB335]|uniref:DUF5825 family protein n=1 Tax=Solwaraspora sp. WMMB335 TaxID=3404118 RepID=UPI003B92A5FF